MGPTPGVSLREVSVLQVSVKRELTVNNFFCFRLLNLTAQCYNSNILKFAYQEKLEANQENTEVQSAQCISQNTRTKIAMN